MHRPPSSDQKFSDLIWVVREQRFRDPQPYRGQCPVRWRRHRSYHQSGRRCGIERQRYRLGNRRAAAPDDFVKWCRSRDYNENRLAAPYHIPSAMTGFEELDAYGGWEAVAESDCDGYFGLRAVASFF
jgi:hypothetical protein